MSYDNYLKAAHVLLLSSSPPICRSTKPDLPQYCRKTQRIRMQNVRSIIISPPGVLKLDVKICYTNFQRAWKLTADDRLRWIVTYRETQRCESFLLLRGAAQRFVRIYKRAHRS
jgi:hypothetical protein